MEHQGVEAIRLNIGAGPTTLPGFQNIDIKDGADASKLWFADETVEEIYASHVLEHWPYEQTVNVLRDWARVLKPNARMRISVPDFDILVQQYSKGTMLPIEGIIMGGHTDEHDFHRAIFTRDKLAQAMRMAGLRNIRRWQSNNDHCSRLPISLNLEGFKRPESRPERTTFCLTLPRLCFTDNVTCLFAASARLRIPILTSSGVYWAHGMTTIWKQALEADAKYIVHVDYDSIFTAEDVVDMYSIMDGNRDIDALCAVQVHRDSAAVLMNLEGADGKPEMEISGESMMADTMPIRAGHFGLTFIRCDSLAKLPMPWFVGHPGENGDWGKDKIDDDIHFWNQWRAAGFSVHSANSVPIGHIQRVITWPGRRGGCIHQYVNDYADEGKPLEAL